MLRHLVLTLVLLLPTPAFADDVVPSDSPTPTTSSEPTATTEPEPTNTLEWDQTPPPGSESWGQPPRTLATVYHISGGSYSPPPEASQGPGGWAVVHPGTGVVHGVIVGTIDTYYGNNGRMHIEYMGCPAGCLLRFQTRATADGNVAGWHGPEVKFNKNDDTFDLGYKSQNQDGSTVIRQKLIPSKTALDGWNLGTGLVDIRTEFISNPINGISVKLTKLQETFESKDASVVEFENWKSFDFESSEAMGAQLSQEVDAALVAEGFVIEEPEPSGFVATIQELTEKITGFLGNIFSRD